MTDCDSTNVETRYLSIDSNTFVATEAALKALHHPGGLTRILFAGRDKKLIAYSDHEFHQDAAIAMAQALGFDVRKSWIMTTNDLVERRLEDDGTETCVPKYRHEHERHERR